MKFEAFEILLPLAVIVLFSKLLSLLGKKLGLPQIFGMILTGLLLGLARLSSKIGPTLFHPELKEPLEVIAKIGVILIMFSAGIETDLKQFKKIGFPAFLITILGVVFPLFLGFIVAWGALGEFKTLTSDKAITFVFYGAVLSATSVSITVAALKELGKLNSRVGNAIIAAAILDDIIGIILLSFLIGLKNPTSSGRSVPEMIGMMILFFVVSAVLGIVIRTAMNSFARKYPHRRRLPILGFAICFFYAYAAEKIFGVADITGAYIAGLILAGIKESKYIDEKIESAKYLIFAPVFFAMIGINANFTNFDKGFVLFGILFIIAGIVGKLFGCGFGALACKFGLKDSLRVGLGMMVRAEVLLVCIDKGTRANIISESIIPYALILIIITTLLTPILLKVSYSSGKSKSVGIDKELEELNATYKGEDLTSW